MSVYEDIQELFEDYELQLRSILYYPTSDEGMKELIISSNDLNVPLNPNFWTRLCELFEGEVMLKIITKSPVNNWCVYFEGVNDDTVVEGENGA